MITRLGTSFWAGTGQRLGRSLEVPGLGKAGQMLEVWGWRFWGDLVRCWPNVFSLGAPPRPYRDIFLQVIVELTHIMADVFHKKTLVKP